MSPPARLSPTPPDVAAGLGVRPSRVLALPGAWLLGALAGVASQLAALWRTRVRLEPGRA